MPNDSFRIGDINVLEKLATTRSRFLRSLGAMNMDMEVLKQTIKLFDNLQDSYPLRTMNHFNIKWFLERGCINRKLFECIECKLSGAH